MWAKIKKAINSTLGTQNFKPLDEIIKTEAKKITDDLSDGSFVVNRSKNDKYGREIDKSYYSLVGGEHMAEITNGTLDDVKEAGNYYISWDNWFNNEVVGLPTDSRDGKGGAILTVELDTEPNANRVYQTLRFMNVPSSAEDNSPIRKRSVVYHRDIDWEGGENLSKVISPWRRLVSAEEIENGSIRLTQTFPTINSYKIGSAGIYSVSYKESGSSTTYKTGLITIVNLDYSYIGSSVENISSSGTKYTQTIKYTKEKGIFVDRDGSQEQVSISVYKLASF